MGEGEKTQMRRHFECKGEKKTKYIMNLQSHAVAKECEILREQHKILHGSRMRGHLEMKFQ